MTEAVTDNQVINVSCVVDRDPKFAMQAWNWLLSLRASGTRAKPFICCVDGALTAGQKERFASLGAYVTPIASFGTGLAAYCNKIEQLRNHHVVDCDWLILSDADVCFLGKLEGLLSGASFRAKPVDLSSPSRADLEFWMREAGINWFGDGPVDLQDDAVTLRNNFNGGLYVIHRSLFGDLERIWREWAAKLLARAPEGKSWVFHADQIAMAIAIDRLGVEVDLLPRSWNYPSHLIERGLSLEACDVNALHYHQRMDDHGLPALTGVAWLDERIGALRSVLVQNRRNDFDNETFWNFRYQYAPALGSGLGSRGDALAYKRQVLEQFFSQNRESSVLDVGCGDLEAVRNLLLTKYTGLDVSEQAISIAQAKRPDWAFVCGSPYGVQPLSFDYVICLDVLIHQSGGDQARLLLDQLLQIASRGLVLTLHSSPASDVGISFNSHSLLGYLHSAKEVSDVRVLGGYRDVCIIAVDKNPI